MAVATSQLSGSGNQQIWISLTYVSYNAAGNYSSWDWEIRYYGNGWGSWGHTVYWRLSGFAVSNGGSYYIPQSEAYLTYKRLGGGRFTKAHDSNGRLAAGTLTGHITCSHTSIGSGSAGVSSGTPPRIPRAPGAGGAVTVSNITPTGARFTWPASSRGHANITQYGLYVSESSSFNGHAFADWVGTSRDKTLNNLLPGTRYYARVRAQNSDGTGAYGPVSSFTTLPSTPPTLVSATPDATGRQSVITMTPPGGISAVNSYTIERRTPGGSWTTAASGSANPTQTVTGLTPGQTYEWRVKALIGTYTTPVSNTLTRTQPQPNASPGAFWDGDTADSPTTNYEWTGTAGSSVSEAQTLTGGAIGWLSGDAAVAVSGGMAVQYQIAGGLEPNNNGGDWSVQYVVLTDATSNGFRGGTDGDEGYAAVTVGGFYMGSIWVESSRDRDLAAMWVWYDVNGAEVGTSVGSPVGVTAGTAQRLTVLGQAPVGAVRGAVVFTDPDGTSLMESGDTVTADAAMGSTGTLYPYFDGDTDDTERYIYGWEGDEYISPSYRESIPQADQNPLQDPNCDPIPTPPSPPPIEADCIVPIGSWRRTWYVVDAGVIPDYLSAVPTVSLQTFGEPEAQVRVRWYPNPDCLPPLSFDASAWSFEQIVSFLPENTTMTLDGVSQRVWAEVPTGSDPIPADSLLYGTGGVPATWPTVSCGICWLISLDTALDSTPGNLVVSANMTVRE